jgi:ubiquinone/menaquinone biosynthesis C-methylase UbiE
MGNILDKISSIIPQNKASSDDMVFNSGKLTSLNYEESYYEEHKDAGLDYLAHGYWQESYAKMVADVTLQTTYDSPSFFDGGCACGSVVAAFKKTDIFAAVLGVDLSEHMVGLGRKHFGLSGGELISGSISEIPVESDSFTLVHSSQVLEHIPEKFTDAILDEFARILRPGGRAFLCLDAIRHGETKEIYMGDPTHVNIQPIMYWTKKIQDRGLYFDVEAYNRFVKSPHGPTEGDSRNFYEQYPYWSAWTLIKA